MKIREREKSKLKKATKSNHKKGVKGKDKVKNKASSRSLSKKRPKFLETYEGEEDVYLEEGKNHSVSYDYEEEDIDEIAEEIAEFLDYKPDFIPIEFTEGWVIIAKIKTLRINNVYNASGFQPVDNTQEQKKCLLTIVEFGREPRRGEFAHRLKKAGCPSIRILSKYDISGKLEGI